MEILSMWSGEPGSSSLLTYVTKWIRVLVISGSYVVDKKQQYTMNTRWNKIAGDMLELKLKDIYSQFSSAW